MPIEVAYGVFLPCLAAIMLGSICLSRDLEGLGDAFGILPGLLGLITALGADSPEISSAVTALFAGQSEVGLGVVLGSNLFNLAALLGFSGVLAGNVPLQRNSLLFNGAVSLLVTGIAALLIYQLLSPLGSIIILGLILTAYAFLLWAHTPEVRRLPLPLPFSHALAELVGKVHEQASRRGGGRRRSKRSLKRLAIYVAGALVLIVAGSMGIVHATLVIAANWGISQSLVGALILAVLTGIPNTYTAVVLGLEKKGTAVVSETLNSNTINIVVGVALPALFFGMHGDKDIAILELWWLIGMTAVAVLLPALTRGINRSIGLLIIALYLAFVAVRIFLG